MLVLTAWPLSPASRSASGLPPVHQLRDTTDLLTQRMFADCAVGPPAASDGQRGDALRIIDLRLGCVSGHRRSFALTKQPGSTTSAHKVDHPDVTLRPAEPRRDTTSVDYLYPDKSLRCGEAAKLVTAR